MNKVQVIDNVTTVGVYVFGIYFQFATFLETGVYIDIY